MSVLIKGMDKLPEDGAVLTVKHSDDGKVYIKSVSMWGYSSELVEILAKHGRLIDEDNVIDAIHERLRILQSHKEFAKKHGDIDLLGVLPYIAKIKSVVEAEGD